MTDWCCDIEAVRQFYIDGNIRICIKVGRKVTLIRGVVHNMVV